MWQRQRGLDGEQAKMEPHQPPAADDSTGATGTQPLTPIAAAESQREALAEVAQVALKLGFTAFGGPAAHIAMLREETVVRRQWLTDAYFLDLVGATNLIPGPNSTEMVIHVGYLRAGWRGLLVAGTLFILPSSLRPSGDSAAPRSTDPCCSGSARLPPHSISPGSMS